MGSANLDIPAFLSSIVILSAAKNLCNVARSGRVHRSFAWLRMTARSYSLCGGKRVFEIVGVLAVSDIDCHLSRDSCQLASPGIWDHGDDEVGRVLRHGSSVLDYEAAASAMESSGDLFDGDVSSGAFDGSACGEHLAFAGGFEVAVILFVEGQATEERVVGFVLLGYNFYVEGSSGVHGCESLFRIGRLGGGLRGERGHENQKSDGDSSGLSINNFHPELPQWRSQNYAFPGLGFHSYHFSQDLRTGLTNAAALQLERRQVVRVGV